MSAADESIGIALRLYVDQDSYNRVMEQLNQLQNRINSLRMNIEEMGRTRAPIRISGEEVRTPEERGPRPEVIRSVREEYERFLEANADLVKRMQLQAKVWNDIVRMTKAGRLSQAELNRLAEDYAEIAGMTVTEARRQIRVLQALQREQRAIQLWRNITVLASSATASQADLNAAIALYAREIGRTQRDVRQWVASYQDLIRQQRIASITARALRYRQGLLGQAFRELGSTVFWLGLGLMFMVMSIQRVNRSLYSITLAARGVRRAQEDLREAQEDYTRALMEFGPGSEEARMAYRRLRDAQEAVRMSQIRVREAQEAYINSILMFVFGTIPTFIRAGISMYDILTKVIVTKYIASRATAQMTAAEETYLAVETAGKPLRVMIIGLTNAQALATQKLAIAIGAATFGISILLGYLAHLYVQQQMNQAMAEATTESYERMENVLTGHSLVDSLSQTELAIKSLNKAIRSSFNLYERNRSLVESSSESYESLENVLTRHSVVDSFKMVSHEVESFNKQISRSYLHEKNILSLTDRVSESYSSLSRMLLRYPHLDLSNIQSAMEEINQAVSRTSQSFQDLGSEVLRTGSSYRLLEDILLRYSVVDSLARTREEISKMSMETKQSLATISTEQARDQITELSKEISKLPLKSHSPLEIKTQYGWVDLSQLSNLDLDLGNKLSVASNNVQVSISISGPFYIREEADIDKIAKAVKRSLMSGVRSKVGGTLV